MPPPKMETLTWNIIGKATLAALVTWAAYEFREMRVAVYSGQTKQALSDMRLSTVEKEQDKTNERVKKLEARVFKEQ